MTDISITFNRKISRYIVNYKIQKILQLNLSGKLEGVIINRILQTQNVELVVKSAL